MEYRHSTKIVGLSVVVAALLGSNAYAGKIITDADVNNIVIEENTQFGFGGWNFDNVTMRIVNINDFSTALPGTNFNTLDGTYTPMGVDESFEGEIKNAAGVVMGHLHGKDWPVGEPAGIKIINDDNVKPPKPVNCIMTSSYLPYQVEDDDTSGSAYLDAFAEGNVPKPVLCSSGWQSHKRYKINLLPTTVANLDAEGYGEPVDVVFNLDMSDTDPVVRRYQLLQKVNNYTDKRLDGFKVEVLDANGQPNPALTLSLGLGEGVDKNGTLDGSDIWGENELANYSHGLWGPYQAVNGFVRFDNGFFDYIRSYYAPALAADKTSMSYIGNMLGGNYQAIFGNWLPSIWAPMGIFWDDDMDPATDGILMTFYGIAPGETELAWWTRSVVDVDPEDNIDPVYTWAQATPAELEEWQGEWYAEDHVEDVLNLGLNYIIEVGENAQIGSTFTLRLTPHVAADQTVPVYVPVPVNPTDNDFNGDGNADILWKNIKGNHTISLIDGTGVIGTDYIGQADSNVSGIDDFDADGMADILWKNAAGNHTISFANGSANLFIGNPNDSVQGTGDFDADGMADILWKNAAGNHTVTFANGSASLFIGQPNDSVQSTADFNGDGFDDILWKNAAGNHVASMMNGTGVIATAFLGKASWIAESAGNFDTDNLADILWKNAAGNHTVTFADGSANLFIGNPNDSVQGTADFNGDGFDDIIWKNAAGNHVIDLSEGAGTIFIGNATSSVQPE